MSTLSFRIDDELKKQFNQVTDEIWIDSSTALRFFVKKLVKNPSIIDLNMDSELNDEIMAMWESSFSEVWDNLEDDIYSKLYNNVQ